MGPVQESALPPGVTVEESERLVCMQLKVPPLTLTLRDRGVINGLVPAPLLCSHLEPLPLRYKCLLLKYLD